MHDHTVVTTLVYQMRTLADGANLGFLLLFYANYMCVNPPVHLDTLMCSAMDKSSDTGGGGSQTGDLYAAYCVEADDDLPTQLVADVDRLAFVDSDLLGYLAPYILCTYGSVGTHGALPALWRSLVYNLRPYEVCARSAHTDTHADAQHNCGARARTETTL
jgi:hypothetical protein